MASTPSRPDVRRKLKPRNLGKEFSSMPPTPSTPKKSAPPPPVMRKKVARSYPRVLVQEMLELCNLGDTPVKTWPKGFWTARKNIYAEEEEMWRPATPVEICPPSPEDIFSP